MGRGWREEPQREIDGITWEGKVSGLHDSLHVDIVSNVNNNVISAVNDNVKHVRISKYVQIKIIDDEDQESNTTTVDSNIFSMDITDNSEVFGDDLLLLDTCAGESVFRSDTLFYDIVPAHTPLVINGVNTRGEPLTIRECGRTDFGVVYRDPNCIANILSFANMVNNCYSVKCNRKGDFYSLQVIRGECCYYFNRDVKHNIYIYVI